MDMAWSKINHIDPATPPIWYSFGIDLAYWEQILRSGKISNTIVIPGWFCHGCRGKRENCMCMAKRTF